jgi:alcohol dehydrogenase
MKAAILHALGAPLAIETMPNPIAGPGEVVVEVVAAPVLSYTNEVFDGTRSYHLMFPMTPGCGAVGRVRTTGPDATRLAPGEWVFCDPTVRARDDALTPDIMLQGWTAPTEGARRLQQWMRDGGPLQSRCACQWNAFSRSATSRSRMRRAGALRS